MSVYFISDPHLGHKNIAKYRPFVSSTEDNTKQFLEDWETHRIRSTDIVFFLGDVAFDEESLKIISTLRGRKILVKGNHDDYVSTKLQAEVFEEIYGIYLYKEFWLSHCPIHPSEMRNRKCNLHGHVHAATVMKNGLFSSRPHPKYLNLCVDNTRLIFNSWLVSLEQVRTHLDAR